MVGKILIVMNASILFHEFSFILIKKHIFNVYFHVF